MSGRDGDRVRQRGVREVGGQRPGRVREIEHRIIAIKNDFSFGIVRVSENIKTQQVAMAQA